MVEQRPFKAWVLGSSPRPITSFSMKISTPRFVLRRFDLSDALFLYEMNLDSEVLKYTGDVPFTDILAASNFINAYDHYNLYGVGRWMILDRTEKNRRYGWCGLKYHPEQEYYDIGFRLKKKFWGRGIATECARECLEFAEEHGHTPVVGRVHPQNFASKAVLIKLGLNYIETIQENSEVFELFKRMD